MCINIDIYLQCRLINICFVKLSAGYPSYNILIFGENISNVVPHKCKVYNIVLISIIVILYISSPEFILCL